MVAKGGNIIYFPKGINDNGSMQYYFQVSDSRSNSLIRLTDGFVHNCDWRAMNFISVPGVTTTPVVVTGLCGVNEVNDDQYDMRGLLHDLKVSFFDAKLTSLTLPISGGKYGVSHAIVSKDAIAIGLLPSQTFAAITNSNLELVFDAICELHNDGVTTERDLSTLRECIDCELSELTQSHNLDNPTSMRM